MLATFQSLHTEFVLASFDKQLRLAEMHGEDSWGVDLSQGEISFNESATYKIQILGTEDHVNQTWMWGWFNTASNLPNELLIAANELRVHGEQHSIGQLTTGKLPMDELEGHAVGLTASGFSSAKAYYRCPYENGALFVLITDAKLELPVENKIVRATRVIPECVSALEVANHRQATAAYLRQNGFDVQEDGRNLLVPGADRPMLTAKFDERNRLTKLESHLNPKN